MRQVLTGTVAAHGMALGRARLVQPSRYAVDTRPLAESEIDQELVLLDRALETARQELRELREKLHGVLAREVNEFIDAHSLLLDDAELLRGLEDMVRIGRYRPGAALKKQRDRLSAMFDAMDDPYLRSRKEDVEQVINRVISALQRQTSPEERKLAARVVRTVSACTAPNCCSSSTGSHPRKTNSSAPTVIWCWAWAVRR
jgi:phosphotransferase system enzyme I (PtsI)